jgi:hypothetical protein
MIVATHRLCGFDRAVAKKNAGRMPALPLKRSHLADMGRSVLRPYVILPWLCGGGDGFGFARGFPEGDVGF